MAVEVKFLSKNGGALPLNVPIYSLIPSHKRFAGYQKIRGIPLSPWRFRTQLSATKRSQCAKKLGTFLRSLHSLRTTETLPHQNLTKELKECRSLYGKYAKRMLSLNTNQLLTKYLESYEKMLPSIPRTTVTHGDLYWRHILWDRDRQTLSGCIDFGDMSFDDPAVDFAYCWHYGRKFLESVLDVYGADEEFRKRVYLHTFFRCFRTLCFAAKANDARVPDSKREIVDVIEKFSRELL